LFLYFLFFSNSNFYVVYRISSPIEHKTFLSITLITLKGTVDKLDIYLLRGCDGYPVRKKDPARRYFVGTECSLACKAIREK